MVSSGAPGLLWSEGWVGPFDRPRMPIVLGEGRQAVLGSWTLVPPWVDPADPEAVRKQSKMTANARCETLFQLASFREAAVNHRCLVLATAFREWQWQDPKGKTKVAHDIRPGSGAPFFMAGLYTEWNGQLTYTIVTKPANALMTRIHNGVRAHTGLVEPRMPVIIGLADVDRWLTPGPREPVEDLFLPRDDDGLVATADRAQGVFDF